MFSIKKDCDNGVGVDSFDILLVMRKWGVQDCIRVVIGGVNLGV